MHQWIIKRVIFIVLTRRNYRPGDNQMYTQWNSVYISLHKHIYDLRRKKSQMSDNRIAGSDRTLSKNCMYCFFEASVFLTLSWSLNLWFCESHFKLWQRRMSHGRARMHARACVRACVYPSRSHALATDAHVCISSVRLHGRAKNSSPRINTQDYITSRIKFAED